MIDTDKCIECGITKDELPELQTLESCLCWTCYFELEEAIE